jgi:hypothetical protein
MQIFPQFLSFQCEASGWPLFAFERVWLRRPDDNVTRSDVRGFNGQTVRLYIRMREACRMFTKLCTSGRVNEPSGRGPHWF